MAYRSIQLAYKSSFATITLNRPEKRNALNDELMDELPSAFSEVKASDACALILTGAGHAFCSGMDLDALKNLAGRTPEQNLQDSQKIADLFLALYEFPKPTIAAVNGSAIAGGAGLATICDFTLAASDAKFGYTEVRIGFIPAIVSAFLLRQITEKDARDLLLTGRIIRADEAYRIGLVNEIVPADFLLNRAEELALQLSENSPVSLSATKHLLRDFDRDQLKAQITLSVQANADIRAMADFREGIVSFLEKRKPNWSGK